MYSERSLTVSPKTAFNIDDKKIKLISGGSCNTEDWSNDAENTALTSQEHFFL